MDTQTLNPLTEAQIVDAVAAQHAEAVALLSELVAQPSLLGDEAGAQRIMRREFEANGLRVHTFEVDEDKIRDHPGYSPSILPYAGRLNVVGIHQPSGPVRGKSLILNGHIDVVPVGTASMWTTPPLLRTTTTGVDASISSLVNIGFLLTTQAVLMKFWYE